MIRPALTFLLCLYTIGAAGDYQAGYAAHLRGEFEPAIDLYTRAIDSEQLPIEDQARVHHDRGNAYSAIGEHQRALADFEHALELAPGLTRARYNRGLVRFYLGEFTDAATDLGIALEQEPENAYRVMWRYLARARAGLDAREELSHNATVVDQKQWPGPLIAFFLGEGTLAQVVEAARDTDFDKHVTKTCEAAYYVGQQFLVEARPEQARRWLDTAVLTCSRPLVEYSGAHAELARLDETAIPHSRPDGGTAMSDAASEPLDESALSQASADDGAAPPDAASARLDETAVSQSSPDDGAAPSDAASARFDETAVSRSSPEDGALPPDAASALTKAPLYEVTTDVNYRDGPGMNHARLGILPVGARIVVQSTVQEWARFKLPDGAEAFVHGSYLRVVERPSVDVTPLDAQDHITVTRVNYRSGPGSEFARIGTLDSGAPVIVDGEAGDWRRVRVSDSGVAFIRKDFLRQAPRSAVVNDTSGSRRFVTTARVNYRSGPSTEHERVGIIDAEVYVIVDGESGDWRRLRLDDGTHAFVHGEFIRPAD